MRTARRLAAGAERFRAPVQHATDSIRVVDASGIIRNASPAITRISGYAAAEIVGRPGSDWLHPDEAPRVTRFHAGVRETPGLAPPAERRLAMASSKQSPARRRAGRRGRDAGSDPPSCRCPAHRVDLHRFCGCEFESRSGH
ncbi:MAG TPA: PAS domain S-box protein [Thermomicrobiales bacterium]|nr:PAS domain S-box protein [Thermomicrobiales bacterium]